MSSMTDVNPVLTEPIFRSFIKGLSSEYPAVRLSCIEHAFWLMDRLSSSGSEREKNAVQKIFQIVNLHLRSEESMPQVSPKSLSKTVSQEILRLIGDRLRPTEVVSPSEFAGNGTLSQHFYSPMHLDSKDDLPRVFMLGARLNFEGVNLSGSCLSGMNFSEASFAMSSFDKCDFDRSCFVGSSFNDAIVAGSASGVDFRSSDFSFSRVDLRVEKASFLTSDFSGARCVLRETSGANFFECSFRGADLSGSDYAINLSGSIIDPETVFPDGSRIDGNIEESTLWVETTWGKVRLVSGHSLAGQSR